MPARDVLTFALLLLSALIAPAVLADGKVIRPRHYNGSLEELAQEAIIIFEAGNGETSARQDLILKIRVAGKVDEFAWVVPLPNPPETAKADAKLFAELFAYVDARRVRNTAKKPGLKSENAASSAKTDGKIEVVSRDVVGSFDVAVVREKQQGALNEWLKDEGYQSLDDAQDVIGYYREKGFVFVCIKVTDAELSKSDSQQVDLHPLRFRFDTGGRDGIYFPMRMTGLQSETFDVNLYIFHRYWINDRINQFGYAHRGFDLRYRDWDTPQCKANGGKAWSNPKTDPLLGGLAHLVPTVAATLAESHPGRRFYLTNIQADNLDPKSVRRWQSDLWLFPYYTNAKFVPYDARDGGPAADAVK